jgi:D-methionine transport system substrate-binding protein
LRYRISLLFGLALLSSAAAAVTHVRIGVSDGPQAEIPAFVKQIAAQQGATRKLDIELVTPPQGEQINAALSGGALDAASFEDGVALERSVREHAWPLTAAAQTVTLPMGLYSRRIHRLGELQRGASVRLPQDRHDLSRALLLLHNYGLIGLRDGAVTRATLTDVARNPRGLKLSVVASGKHATALQQADLVALSFPAAAKLGLAPARDGLGMEDARSPYAGVLTVRSKDKDAPWLRDLVALYRSEEVQRFILKHYEDSVRRPW